MLNGERVFLVGGNLPWINYAYDFGNNQWAGVKSRVEDEMKLLRDAGGNTMRIWIHVQGETSPKFNADGYPIATDKEYTLISDVKDMLDLAQSYDILVVPTLWNNAVDQDIHGHMEGLIRSTWKLQYYVNVVLQPLVEAVKGHPALAAWDILNEPEGMLIPGVSDPDPCYDTVKLNDSGAGWAGKRYSFREILRFINWQASTIKQEDPEALVTVGVWNPKSSTNSFSLVNHYDDNCLIKAGYKSLGTIDFFEFHTYSWEGKFDGVSPFKHDYEDYGITKPIVIGEFNEADGGGKTYTQLFDYAYRHGYAGAWSWSLIKNGTQLREGISHIRYYSGNGKMDIDL
ncbi:hypothetical protein RRG08_053303 [Elysia crispata]|uniref:Mannan endo-1,4-beta-mannosidase n=1 Tax=Elysia crispata TaxID=231223 RepID=A0AAE0Z608_9GAST|nr:hypothetical protein RRG08_053303 [Elysia crispata]